MARSHQPQLPRCDLQQPAAPASPTSDLGPTGRAKSTPLTSPGGSCFQSAALSIPTPKAPRGARLLPPPPPVRLPCPRLPLRPHQAHHSAEPRLQPAPSQRPLLALFWGCLIGSGFQNNVPTIGCSFNSSSYSQFWRLGAREGDAGRSAPVRAPFPVHRHCRRP